MGCMPIDMDADVPVRLEDTAHLAEHGREHPDVVFHPRPLVAELTEVPLAEIGGVEVGEVVLLGRFSRQEGQRIRMEDLADYRRRLPTAPTDVATIIAIVFIVLSPCLRRSSRHFQADRPVQLKSVEYPPQTRIQFAAA